MSFRATLDAIELLDSGVVDGEQVVKFLKDLGLDHVETTAVRGGKGSTDFVKMVIPGSHGKTKGEGQPTLGIIGRLGGIGARPEMIGLVSDGDGAVSALAIGIKLARMKKCGDVLPGDVIVTTHVCPDAPTQPSHCALSPMKSTNPNSPSTPASPQACLERCIGEPRWSVTYWRGRLNSWCTVWVKWF